MYSRQIIYCTSKRVWLYARLSDCLHTAYWEKKLHSLWQIQNQHDSFKIAVKKNYEDWSKTINKVVA